MDLDDADNEPCMEEQAPLSLKQTTTSCLISSRSTKPRKINSSTVQTCAVPWAKQTNERFTLLLLVIIKDPEEDSNKSHIDSSLDAGLNNDIANERSTRLAKADAIWVKKAKEILAKKLNSNKMIKAERFRWGKNARARRSKGQKKEMSEKEIDFEPTFLY